MCENSEYLVRISMQVQYLKLTEKDDGVTQYSFLCLRNFVEGRKEGIVVVM